jgi:hypothetical protein
MLRFRLILAWLLLAALPLQGWAAATMLFCGPAQHTAVVAKVHSPADAPSHHDTHTAHHDMQAQAQHHVDTSDTGSTDDGAGHVAGGTHTSGVCAACCHGVALAQTPHWPSIAAAPSADLAEPLVAVLARPSSVPDKPPRA